MDLLVAGNNDTPQQANNNYYIFVASYAITKICIRWYIM